MVIIEGLSQDLIDLAAQDNTDDDDDDGLSGGIVALIVILVLLAILVPAAIVIVYVVYRRKRQGRFDILGSVRPRNYGADYISDNTAANEGYTSTQELQSSQVQEMVSNEPEAITEKLIKDESDSNIPESIKNPNFDNGDDNDKDTRL